MFHEKEDLAVVGADALKDSISIKESVVENRDFRFFFFVKCAVNVDFHKKERVTLIDSKKKSSVFLESLNLDRTPKSS